MKKKHILITVLVSASLIFPALVISQDQELEPNYVLNRDIYFQSYQNYLSAKRAYLNEITLERKSILFRNFKTLLYSRNKLLYSYLDFYLNELKSQLTKTKLDKIRSWQVWLNKNEEDTNDITKVEDLNELYQQSMDLAEVYPEMEADIYKRLVDYAIGNQKDVVSQITEIRDQLEPLTDDQGWAAEVNRKLSQVQNAQVEALKIMEEKDPRRIGDMKRSWNSAKKYLDQAQSHLDITLKFIDEVIKRLE